MDVSLFIARKLRFKGRIAVVSIAVSFLVMIIAVSVSSGFRNEIRDGISFLSGDIQLTPVDLNFLDETSPVDRYPSYLEHVKALAGVESVSAAVYRAGIIKSGEDIHGVLFKGVEQSAGPLPGQTDTLPPMSVSIPARLASMLHLEPGDDLPSYFIGEKVKVRKFTVHSVYDGLVGGDDENLVVFAPISDMQRLNGWSDGQVSALEVMLDRRSKSAGRMSDMQQEIGTLVLLYTSDDEESVVARSAVSRYPQIFDWLNLIDFNVFFILMLMTAVAGFNMISGLLIMLFENISTIGLLKSLGMADRQIAKIFIIRASSVMLKGILAGNALALLFCLVQGLTHVIRLDPSNYFISYVPVRVDVAAYLAADFAAYVLIMLLLLIPSLFITKIDPARTVRVE